MLSKGWAKSAQIAYFLFFALSFFGPALGGIALAGVTLYPARVLAPIAWLTAGIFFVRQRTLPRNWSSLFLGLWALWALVSLFWAQDINLAVRDLGNLAAGLSLAALAPLLSGKEERAAGVWLGSLGFCLLLAWTEYFTAWHLPVSRFSRGAQPHLARRPTAVFANENNFAVFLNLSLPFLWAGWDRFPRFLPRLGTAVAVFSCLYMLAVTGSRLNYLVLAVAVLIFACFLTPRGRRVRVLAVLTATVVCTWLLFVFFDPALGGYTVADCLAGARSLLSWLETGQSGGSNSLAVRVNLFKEGLRLLVATKGAGAGPGNFEVWVASRAASETRGVTSPHNWWLELLAEYGVLIFTAYLLFYFDLLRRLWRDWRRHWLSRALALALAVFPLAAAGPSSVMTFMPHWLLLALARVQAETEGAESCAC